MRLRALASCFPPALAETPGAGAAGGLGFGLLAFCRARIVSGFGMVAGLIKLEETIAAADLVVTGEGCLDAQTLDGKGPHGVAELAHTHGRPVVGIGGRVLDEARPAFDLTIAVTPPEMPLDEAIRRAPELIEEADLQGGSGPVKPREEMSHPVVLLFSGQGAQKVGMGSDLVAAFPAAASLFAEAAGVLGPDLTSVMADGPPETLTRTSYCQPALYLHGLACLAVLEERHPSLEVAACAGLSLGEFTAHAAAGTVSFSDGLRLVAARGRFMDEACEQTAGAMAAMIGGDEAAVRELAAHCDVDVANLNAPGQIVLSGSTDGIAKAVEQAKSRGIRLAKRLDVAGAYHSRLMASARENLARELAATRMTRPRCPVIANVTAQAVTEPDEIRRTLEAQVTGSVRWTESMRLLLNQGHRHFLELGPGGVLAGLMGRIDKTAIVTPIEDVASIERAVAPLSG